MRGLKHRITNLTSLIGIVASFTDAWIETITLSMPTPKRIVASFTDAWIETIYFICLGYARLSHLLQMRGLKLASFFICP